MRRILMSIENNSRRSFLEFAAVGLAGATVGLAQPAGAITLPNALQDKRNVSANGAPTYDVRTFGAKGDGKAIDTPAVNKAIETAAYAGGGIVRFPAGTYACFSIHLKSKVTLYVEPGAIILAAESGSAGQYDLAEPNQWDKFQDYGHSHWHNSLIWGEGVENVAILGPGLIWGKGLSRGTSREGPKAEDPGVGNTAISLQNCRNVILRDFSLLP